VPALRYTRPLVTTLFCSAALFTTAFTRVVDNADGYNSHHRSYLRCVCSVTACHACPWLILLPMPFLPLFSFTVTCGYVLRDVTAFYTTCNVCLPFTTRSFTVLIIRFTDCWIWRSYLPAFVWFCYVRYRYTVCCSATSVWFAYVAATFYPAPAFTRRFANVLIRSAHTFACYLWLYVATTRHAAVPAPAFGCFPPLPPFCR